MRPRFVALSFEIDLGEFDLRLTTSISQPLDGRRVTSFPSISTGASPTGSNGATEIGEGQQELDPWDTNRRSQTPEPPALRESLRRRCRAAADRLDPSRPLDKPSIERVARSILADADQPESLLGWTMVSLASEFWRDHVAATPTNRRLLLLPTCPTQKDAGRQVAELSSQATGLGYRVLAVDNTPDVVAAILGGEVDAIVGVAGLDLLEKAFDKVLPAGVPCMAAPLLCGERQESAVEEDWLRETIHLRFDAAPARPADGPVAANSFLPLLRLAKRMFDTEQLARLLPRRRELSTRLTDDPVAATEQIAYDFIARGGKYSRPFITLAAQAAASGHNTPPEQLPDAVKRVALSIEVFHKASLVHDDIQDDDPHRYGSPTLHREHGVPMAINVGDYLIGLGYQLIAGEAAAIGPQATADILQKLSLAHVRLTEGQGAELVWRGRADKRLTPDDALTIYALKTSPAFEAALYGGVRLAVDAASLEAPIHEFSKHLGVAFQILNDLMDWRGDDDNKLAAGGDVLGGRPTLLLALALDALEGADRDELLAIAANPPADALPRVRRLYQQAEVFATANRIVDDLRREAQAIADGLPTDDLRRLAHYLIDTVLQRSA